MKVNLTVGRTPTHLPKKVICKGQEYIIPFPVTPHNFLQIVEVLHISPEYESTLQVLSKKRDSVNSVGDFYKLQGECQQYFGVGVEMDYLGVALSVLSQTELALKQLDQLTLKDLFAVLKQGYDGLTSKTHSKLERRLKKYLAETQRPLSQKNEIEKFFQYVKAESTDEQVEEKEEKSEKLIQKTFTKNKKLQQRPQQVSKQYLSELEKHEPEHQQPEKPGKHRKHHAHHGHRKSQDEEADWEDIDEEKLNKRMEKNLKKKHVLEDTKVEEGQAPRKNQPRERKEVEDRKIFSNYKEKQEKDLKVQLGILGDTDEGWRQRCRVGRVPVR